MSGDDWDAHWRRLAVWMLANPAYRYRRDLIWRALALEEARAPVRLVDIGCGEGSFAAALAERRPEIAIAGYDGSAQGIATAARRVPAGRFFATDLAAPPVELRGWATHALCAEAIEHLDRPIEALAAARELLAAEGRMVITVPAGPISAFDRHVGHRKHYTEAILRAELAAAGLAADFVWRAGFPFHTLYRLVVVLRGGQAVEDSAAPARGLQALAFRAFDALFRFNLRDAPLGWQIVARVRRA
ncbi:MAG: methyltransferase domain-containing protein [Alphaproteobacteria bacterium]|nr:methyltransferase domain-containing protein [Alphaproteobacteria bacterium]